MCPADHQANTILEYNDLPYLMTTVVKKKITFRKL